MEMTPGQAAEAAERHDCPKCEAPAGSPVKVAYQSFARAVTTAPLGCDAADVPSCPRVTVQLVVPRPPVTCMTSLPMRM